MAVELYPAPYSPFGALPMELVLRVFELAASRCLTTTLALSLVCTVSRRVVIRFLYSTLAIHTRADRHSAARLRTLPQSYRAFLRHLWLESDIPFQEDPHTLAYYVQKTVSHLALPSSYLLPLLTMPTSPVDLISYSTLNDGDNEFEFPCRELTILRDDLSRAGWTSSRRDPTLHGLAFLRGITHLRLCSDNASDLNLIPLKHLPALTHIAFPVEFIRLRSEDDVERTISRVKMAQLEKIVMVVCPIIGLPRLFELAGMAINVDARLFVVEAPMTQNLARDDWEEAARGGEDIWERAAKLRQWLARPSINTQYDAGRQGHGRQSLGDFLD